LNPFSALKEEKETEMTYTTISIQLGQPHFCKWAGQLVCTLTAGRRFTGFEPNPLTNPSMQAATPPALAIDHYLDHPPTLPDFDIVRLLDLDLNQAPNPDSDQDSDIGFEALDHDPN
jgi:hypothetical protein